MNREPVDEWDRTSVEQPAQWKKLSKEEEKRRRTNRIKVKKQHTLLLYYKIIQYSAQMNVSTDYWYRLLSIYIYMHTLTYTMNEWIEHTVPDGPSYWGAPKNLKSCICEFGLIGEWHIFGYTASIILYVKGNMALHVLRLSNIVFFLNVFYSMDVCM